MRKCTAACEAATHFHLKILQPLHTAHSTVEIHVISSTPSSSQLLLGILAPYPVQLDQNIPFLISHANGK